MLFIKCMHLFSCMHCRILLLLLVFGLVALFMPLVGSRGPVNLSVTSESNYVYIARGCLLLFIYILVFVFGELCLT